jgi:hypothetical protein
VRPRYGHEYLSAIERSLNLTSHQRNVVTAYAVLHRICWLSEKGIQWNLNASNAIDAEAVHQDMATITALRTELRIGC